MDLTYRPEGVRIVTVPTGREPIQGELAGLPVTAHIVTSVRCLPARCSPLLDCYESALILQSSNRASNRENEARRGRRGPPRAARAGRSADDESASSQSRDHAS